MIVSVSARHSVVCGDGVSVGRFAMNHGNFYILFHNL